MILQSHSGPGLAAATHPGGLLPLSANALRFHERQGLQPFSGATLDDEAISSHVAVLGAHELVLRRNAGLLVVGTDMPTAIDALAAAECAARAQIDILSTTEWPEIPSEAVCTATAGPPAPDGRQLRRWERLLADHRAATGTGSLSDAAA